MQGSIFLFLNGKKSMLMTGGHALSAANDSEEHIVYCIIIVSFEADNAKTGLGNVTEKMI